MFKWLNKQGVESDDGFIVQMTDRYHIEYREGEKILTLKVDIGFLAGNPCIILEKNAIQRWDNQSLSLNFSDDKKHRIFNNLTAALKFQDMGISVGAPSA